MNNELKSSSWGTTMEAIRACHVSKLRPDSVDVKAWKDAFEKLMASIKEERKLNPAFARELSSLTEDSGAAYDFEDILEEYFDTLEDARDWDDVVASCDEIVENFVWEKNLPSQYMFRKGNALEYAGKLEEAEAFGKEWLKLYPTDLYAAASNVYLMLNLKKYDEAEALTEKYLRDDLVCSDETDTFYMAAYRLFELTDNINAKQRIEKKMADYQNFMK